MPFAILTDKKMPPVERISIWILEALEEEWRREPDLMKCRLTSEVLGPLKDRYKIEDKDITRALHFMLADSRRYLTVLTRPDGQAILPSDNGLAIMAKIAESRIEDTEKKKWSRSDKIALASFVFSVVTFAIGFFAGAQSSKKSDGNQPAMQQTNSAPVAHKLP